MDRIAELEEKIIKAKYAYYMTDQTIVSDAEYDKLEAELKSLKPDSFALTMVGVKDGDVDLIYPMYSTDKSLNLDELQTYWNRMPSNGEIVISQKVDGMSTSLKYIHAIS